MNTTHFRSFALVVSLFVVPAFISANVASAQGPGSSVPGVVGFTLTFDEFGAGLLNGNPNPGVPASGGGLNFTLPVPVLPGFVLVTNPLDISPTNPNGITDLLSFSNQTLTSGQTVGVMLFQSLKEDGDDTALADVSLLQFPQPIVSIFEVGPEGANVFTWVPDPSNTFGAVYHGISDGRVPEPSTLILGALGLIALLVIGRRRVIAQWA